MAPGSKGSQVGRQNTTKSVIRINNSMSQLMNIGVVVLIGAILFFGIVAFLGWITEERK